MRPPTRASDPAIPGPDDDPGARPRARPVGDDELQRLLACLPGQALVLLDRDGTILTWNPGAEALTGPAAGDVVGAWVEVLYPCEAVAGARGPGGRYSTVTLLARFRGLSMSRSSARAAW